MKQFKCYRLDRTYTAAEVASLFPLSSLDLAPASVGEEIVDRDGDRWVRLADSDDERLERIATAALAAIIAKHPPVTANEDDATARNIREASANGAVAYAKALIAELDKQA